MKFVFLLTLNDFLQCTMDFQISVKHFASYSQLGYM